MLYGKVDYIVTDSPILLAGIYQDFKSAGEHKYVGQTAKAFMGQARKSGVVYRNFFLERSKPFDPRGRYESEEEAKELDRFIYKYLCEIAEENPSECPIRISGPNEIRDYETLSHLPTIAPASP